MNVNQPFNLSGSFIDPRVSGAETFLELVPHCGVSSSNARSLLGAIIGDGLLDPGKWAKAGIIKRKVAEKIPHLPELTLVKTETSEVDGFQKLLFRTQDDLSVETVIIPLHKERRVTVCLSSQVGCVMGCTFCATARMARRRNLSSWEILDQMRQARQIAMMTGRKVTGAAFMGMGEPFLNYENVLRSATLLSYPVRNAIRSKAITVSTVGLTAEIRRFTSERRPFRLSISLGAATDEKRRILVPVAARTRISEVMAAARDYAISRNDRVMLSYICIGGINMFEEDARELARLIGDTQVRFDLIEVTDTSGLYRRPTALELKEFRDALSKYLRQPVVRRYSGGADINAACGTLAGAV